MDGAHGYQNSGDFHFQKPPKTPEPETPTVGPLRIHKVNHSASTTSTTSSPSRTSSEEAEVDGTSQTRFRSPPYPDDRPRPLHAAAGAQRQGTPEVKPPTMRRQSSARAKFGAHDPNRPTVSGYAGTPPPSLTPGVIGDRDKLVPEVPGKEKAVDDDDDGLFQRLLPKPTMPAVPVGDEGLAQSTFQQYYPPPTAATLQPPSAGVNRLSSSASTSTTRAQRGSPPPPETPILGRPVGTFDTAYPYAQTAAASRTNQYANPAARPPTMSPSQHPVEVPRPWTPTEQPGSYPHGPPVAFQGDTEVPPATNYQNPTIASYQSPPQPSQNRGYQGSPSHPTQQFVTPPVPQFGVPITQSSSPAQPAQYLQSPQNNQPGSRMSFSPQTHPLEQDIQRLQVGDEPPPAYSSVSQQRLFSGAASQAYLNDKRLSNASLPSTASSSQDPNVRRHPAFANDLSQPVVQQPVVQQPVASTQHTALTPIQITSPSPGASITPASPPPLPEGWIAHLDQNSGQYYYIHLPTQSTQWEFPKGPTPLNLQEPLSPTGTFANPMASPAMNAFNQPLASPGFPPQTASYHRDSIMSMNNLASPTVAGFTGPPPTAGVDMYKVVPTNGVYFGPYLRYTNIDLERGLWLGSILLVTDMPQPPTIHIHQTTDLSPNPRQLKANPIYQHQRWTFYRYDVDLVMDDQDTKWTYAITSHLGCTRYEFLVAGRYETSWRFVSHSGNDFALNVSANERARLGGIGPMWKDVLQKHVECGGFHAQLGLGGQIFGDRLWKEVPTLRQWTAMSGKENRKNEAWSAKLEDDVSHAYFHYYSSHFDQPHVREAFAQIPHVLTLDDNDIFDGYGSYPEYMQQSNMFKNIGRIGIDMYLLFQHHTTHEILRNVSGELDLFTVTGTGWHFIKYLGPAVVVVGPDTRSERDSHRVMAGPTYQGLFPKVATLPPSVQHCIWMIPVPLLYPRLETAEHIAHTMATGKKAVTGTFNILGRMTSSVAGVVGAKGVVGDGFSSIKKAVGKSGLMSSVLSPFGEIDMLDELRDMWTHESKDLERTYMIRTLQGIAHNKSLRMTFLSGSTNACGAALVHDPSRPGDHKTMYQLITSSIVNAPPPSYVLRLLNSNPKQPIYIPQNGQRSAGPHQTPQTVDTQEEMMEIFVADVNGTPREMKRLMGRRNYVAMVAYDPENVRGSHGSIAPNGKTSSRLSLAADFMVQNEGAYAAPVKYGPVIIPSLEFGR
ncbi:hypothetical protein E4T47_06800 [Aureobasidium subglaciale]|nr:hypothetical protein E4T47_06800 [Aureobasidium subglaciale]